MGDFPSKDPKPSPMIGAAMEAHRALKNAFLDAGFQDALAAELGFRSIEFRREGAIPVLYQGHSLGSPHRVDFLCNRVVYVVLKAVKGRASVEDAQILYHVRGDRTQERSPDSS